MFFAEGVIECYVNPCVCVCVFKWVGVRLEMLFSRLSGFLSDAPQ